MRNEREARELLAAEQRNEAELIPLYQEYEAMSRLQKVRHLGSAVRLSQRISELERLIAMRRELYEFPYPEDTDSESTN